MNPKAVAKLVRSRDIVGPKVFMVEKHEKFINKEAKIAEEEMNDPKKRKAGEWSRMSSRSSRGSIGQREPVAIKSTRSGRSSLMSN